MSQTEVLAQSHTSRPEMICSSGENATPDEKSGSRTLAFSIDNIMSDQTKKTSAATPVSRFTDRRDAVRVGRAADGTTRWGICSEADALLTPEAEVVANQRHRDRPEVVSPSCSSSNEARYQLHQQKLKIANAMMLHMATGSGMSPEVGGLFPTAAAAAAAARHAELLLRQYQRQPYHHLQSSVRAERYRQNAADVTSLPVDPVTSSIGRCQLPVSSDVAWCKSDRTADYLSADKSRFTTESHLSGSPWPTRTSHDRCDVTDWSQMATGSLRRRRCSPTGSPRSVVSGCSASSRDEEEIIVDNDADADDRKQFSPTLELPVECPEVVTDSGDADLERTAGSRLSASRWYVVYVLCETCFEVNSHFFNLKHLISLRHFASFMPSYCQKRCILH